MISHESTTKLNFKSITGLRGFAALFVMLFHTGVVVKHFNHDAYINHFVSVGWVGVDIFFLLSGFLLSIPFFIKNNNFSWKKYLKRRLLRILPPYYIQMIILFIFAYLVGHTYSNKDLLSHIFMVHNLFSDFSGSMNPVWWTLPQEFWFYMMLPFIALLFKNKTGFYTVFIFLIIAVLYRYFTFSFIEKNGGSIVRLVNYLPGVIDEFVYGVMFSYIRFSIKPKLSPIKLTAILIIFLFASAYTLSIIDGSIWKNQLLLTFWKTMAGISLGGIVFICSYKEFITQKILANKLMLFMGEISYSIYLWHFIVFYIFSEITLYPYSKTLLAGSLFSEYSFSNIFIFLWPIVILVAYISYLLTEKPFLKIR